MIRLVEGALGTVGPTDQAEIVTPDLVLAPLLGFDRAGGRIGQGAGCYDRAFARLPAARRVGVAWSAQEVDAGAARSLDVALHGIGDGEGMDRMIEPPPPSWRKPAGVFAILALIAVWAALVVLASRWIEQLPMLAQAIVYLIAGIVWICR